MINNIINTSKIPSIKDFLSIEDINQRIDTFSQYLKSIVLNNLKTFDIDRFSMIYPEKFIGFLYVEDIKNVMTELNLKLHK